MLRRCFGSAGPPDGGGRSFGEGMSRFRVDDEGRRQAYHCVIEPFATTNNVSATVTGRLMGTGGGGLVFVVEMERRDYCSPREAIEPAKLNQECPLGVKMKTGQHDI